MTALVELVGTLKRTFSTIRLYGLTHDNTGAAEVQLFAAFSGYLDQHGSLCMVIHSTKMEVDEVTVLEDERKEESLVRTLFVDGVESLTFLAGVTREEMSMVVRAWYGAITHTLDSEHSFATWMWEHEPKSIIASVRPGIADIGTDDNKEAKAAEGRLRQLFDALTARAMPDVPKPMAVVDVASLEVVRAVLGEVSAASLEKKASAEDAMGLDMAKKERVTLASALAQSARGSGQRTLFALWQAFKETPEPAIGALISRVIDELLRQGKIGDVARAIARIGEDPGAEVILLRLGEPQTVSALMRALEARETQPDALALLNAIPASAVDTLAEPYAGATAEIRARLTPVIVQKSPGGENLAMWLLAHGSRVVGPLFELSEKLDPSVREMLLRTALVHDDVDVVLRGLSKISATASDDFRSLVEPHLRHPNPDVRRATLGVYVRSQDPAVPALLQAQIADPEAPLDWQRSCVHALGTFGGASAVGVLVVLLEVHKSRELRIAAATALGGLDVPAGKDALTREASKLFGDRAVKKSAKEALKRMEKKRVSTPPGAGK